MDEEKNGAAAKARKRESNNASSAKLRKMLPTFSNVVTSHWPPNNSGVRIGSVVLAPRPSQTPKEQQQHAYCRAEVTGIQADAGTVSVAFDGADVLVEDCSVPIYSIVPLPTLAASSATTTTTTAALDVMVKREATNSSAASAAVKRPRSPDVFASTAARAVKVERPPFLGAADGGTVNAQATATTKNGKWHFTIPVHENERIASWTHSMLQVIYDIKRWTLSQQQQQRTSLLLPLIVVVFEDYDDLSRFADVAAAADGDFEICVLDGSAPPLRVTSPPRATDEQQHVFADEQLRWLLALKDDVSDTSSAHALLEPHLTPPQHALDSKSLLFQSSPACRVYAAYVVGVEPICSVGIPQVPMTDVLQKLAQLLSEAKLSEERALPVSTVVWDYEDQQAGAPLRSCEWILVVPLSRLQHAILVAVGAARRQQLHALLALGDIGQTVMDMLPKGDLQAALSALHSGALSSPNEFFAHFPLWLALRLLLLDVFCATPNARVAIVLASSFAEALRTSSKFADAVRNALKPLSVMFQLTPNAISNWSSSSETGGGGVVFLTTQQDNVMSIAPLAVVALAHADLVISLQSVECFPRAFLRSTCRVVRIVANDSLPAATAGGAADDEKVGASAPAIWDFRLATCARELLSPTQQQLLARAGTLTEASSATTEGGAGRKKNNKNPFVPHSLLSSYGLLAPKLVDRLPRLHNLVQRLKLMCVTSAVASSPAVNA